MIIKREGNKESLAPVLSKMMPPFKKYIELFAGIGGMYFNLPKIPEKTILNDVSRDMFDIFTVIQNHAQELMNYLDELPFYWDFLQQYKDSEDLVKKVAAKIILFRTSMYEKGVTQRHLFVDVKKNREEFQKNVSKAHEYLKNAYIFNKDVFDFMNVLRNLPNKKNTFIYVDPPYCKSNTMIFENRSWSISKTAQLLDELNDLKVPFIISEYFHEEINDLFLSKGLQVVKLRKKASINKKTLMATDIVGLSYNYAHTLFSYNEKR